MRSGYELCEEVHIPNEKVGKIQVDLDDRDALRWDNIDNIDCSVAE